MQLHRFKPAVAALCALACAAAHGDVASIGVTGDSGEQPTIWQGADWVFTLTRSGDTGYAVAVSYETADGTAVGGTGHDYRPASGIAVIEAGAETASIPVHVLPGDESTEEFFVLNLLAATGIGPEPSFSAEAVFAAGDNPGAADFADVNGDGKADLVVANRGADTVSILLNTTSAGAATPSFAAQQTFATGDFPTAIASADFNGDGRPDLAVGYQNSAKQVSVLLNATVSGSSTAMFGSPQNFAAGNTPGAIAVADVNGDGTPDLVAANSGDDTLSVLLNIAASGAATASFAPQATFATEDAPSAVIAIDVNTDGKPDLAAINQYGGSVSVLINTTAAAALTPSFASTQIEPAYGTDFAAADVNQDGRVDLIVGGGGRVLLNATESAATSAAFLPGQPLVPVYYAALPRTAAADLNGDGRPELFGGYSVSVYRNCTDAGAEVLCNLPAVYFATQETPSDVAAADLNADGKLDLVAVNATDDSVSVLLNTVADAAFGALYDDVNLDVAQAIGTILPFTPPIGGHGGSAVSPWAILGLLVFVGLRRLGELRVRRR